MASDSSDQDERLANMIHLQQLQQKQDIEAQSHEEFRRGLEELVRGHLHTCMTLATCSSAHDSGISGFRERIHQFHEDHDDGETDESDQLVRRRHRRSEEDLEESSAARREQSRIFSRWAARQAQEMITTIERQNRESELLALAGLHAVSMLDSSFLRESPDSRPQGRVEQPTTQASSLLQMWREIEEEQRVDHARERIRARITRLEESNHTRDNASHDRYQERVREGREHNPVTNVSISRSEVSENRAQLEDGNDNLQDRHWTASGNNGASEVAERQAEYRVWDDSQLDSENSSREQSPEPTDGERERVRHIACGWMRANTVSDNSLNNTHGNSHRSELLGENERERVRLIRQWVQGTTQHRDVRGNRRDQTLRYDDVQPGLVLRHARQHEGNQDGFASGREENNRENLNRDSPRLRGRQARVDLLRRIGRERQRELDRLMEQRAVSDFAHRNRIQSFLRGRFLRTQATLEEPRSSNAAGELGQLRERRTVSGLREGFQTRLESPLQELEENNVDYSVNTGSPNETLINLSSRSNGEETESSEGGILNERQESHTLEAEDLERVSIVEAESNNTEQITGIETSDELEHETLLETNQEDTMQNPDTITVRDSLQAGIQEEHPASQADQGLQHTSDNDEEDWHGGADQYARRAWQEDATFPGNVNWNEGNSRTRTTVWQVGPSERRSRFRQIAPSQNNNIQVSDYATDYTLELQELHGRRSVSNVLASEFRESLDRLVRSYLQRQSHNPAPWGLQRTAIAAQNPTLMEQVNQQQNQTQRVNAAVQPFVPLPPPPPPPPRPREQLWHRELRQPTWGRHQLPRTDIPFVPLPLSPPPPPRPREQLWHRELRQPTWGRHQLPRTDIELEMINDLRSEMGRLQQGVTNMQRMLEACMDMQLELQRSVRQEVSAALNRSDQVPHVPIDGSSWVTVRKGQCCICCDTNIDSLLYRCGHMCTCLKCANELLNNSGKCPMCRAPIVEVVRAYCVM